MCSAMIQAANSCYIDNWAAIAKVLSSSVVMGLFVGITVGIILLFLKK